MSLTYDRNTVSTTIHKLVEGVDNVVFINKSEHSNETPSTLELKRKLPGTNGTVQRSYINRKLAKVVDAGTENERTVFAFVKLEVVQPLGFKDADIEIMKDDVEGIYASAEFQDLLGFGIIPT